MKILIFFLCLFVLTTRGAPLSDETDVRLISYAWESGNTRYVFEIPQEKARQLPQWNPETSAMPPLRTSLACAAAKKALQVRFATNLDFQIREIILRRISGFDTWYYDIGCGTTNLAEGCGMRAVILMDGTNVEPDPPPNAADYQYLFREDELHSAEIERNFARTAMGDPKALAAVFALSTNLDPAKTPQLGERLLEILPFLDDPNVARIAAVQTPQVKASVLTHLEAATATVKNVSLRRPIAEAFPLTYNALRANGSGP
jgi:hypothetical protein